MKLFLVASLLPLFQAVVLTPSEERCDDGSCHETSHSTDYTELLQVGHEILPEKNSRRKLVTTAEDKPIRDHLVEEDDEEVGQEEDAETDNESAMQVQQSATSGENWWNQDLGVAYGSGKFQKVDVYWPKREKTEGGWSAVIMMHGKGENSGPHTFAGFCKNLIVAKHGFCFSGGYDQRDGKREKDIYALTKWVYEEAAKGKREINKEKIVLAGYSLGGLTINNILWDKKMGKDLLQGDPPKVSAVMLFAGASSPHANKAKKAKYWPKSTLIMSSPCDPNKGTLYKYSDKLKKALDAEEQQSTLVKPFVNLDDECVPPDDDGKTPECGHQLFKNGSCKDQSWEAVTTFLDGCGV